MLKVIGTHLFIIAAGQKLLMMQNVYEKKKSNFWSNSPTLALVPSLTSVQAVEVWAQHTVRVDFDDQKEIGLRGGVLGGFSQVLIYWGVGPHHLSVCTATDDAASPSGYFIW